MDETSCLYVSSCGILKSCDVQQKDPSSSTPDFNDLTKLTNGCTIYLRSIAISNFVNEIKNIDVSFVLVSGGADNENYNQIFEDYDAFLMFISNDKIIHWFCQNSNVKHKKLTNLPIGMDYHTVASKDFWGEKKTEPLKQETQLLIIKNKSKPFYERKNKCYINFNDPPLDYHYFNDRKEALEHIPENLYFRESVNRNSSWKSQTDYSFVVSPFGNGMDCHRTWEALILGCIPIVRSSGMDPLFDDLPVLIIKDWKEVTQELLDKTINDFKNRTFNYEKLTLKYWKDKIDSYKKPNEGLDVQKKLISETNYYYEILFYIFLLFCIILIFCVVMKKYKYNYYMKLWTKLFYNNHRA